MQNLIQTLILNQGQNMIGNNIFGCEFVSASHAQSKQNVICEINKETPYEHHAIYSDISLISVNSLETEVLFGACLLRVLSETGNLYPVQAVSRSITIGQGAQWGWTYCKKCWLSIVIFGVGGYDMHVQRNLVGYIRLRRILSIHLRTIGIFAKMTVITGNYSVKLR